MNIRHLLIVFAFCVFGFTQKADACSRILYVGDTTSTTNTEEVLRIVGRSLDWRTPIPTNLYVYPRGIKKQSDDSPKAIRWTSKYGAIYAVGYDGGVTEGMNEKGLVINGLFCKGTVYNGEETTGRPPMSLAVFVAWLLDQNATTPEVVAVLKEHNFDIKGATFDGGTVSALHWGVTDAEGRSAIFEFDHGKINIYEGQDMAAMTNDPGFPQMTAINDYWLKVGGANFLPGTVKSPDRYVRGYFFQHNTEKSNDASLGFPIIRSILMNVSVPFHYTVDGDPNVSSTQWRSFANLRDKLYYFDIVNNLGVYYVDLKKCDLREGAPVMRLDTSKHHDFAGDATSLLERHAPFNPMY